MFIMKTKNNHQNVPENSAIDNPKIDIEEGENPFLDYPIYLPGDDIDSIKREKEDGSELDVPGTELDDAQENVGNEDEENNYYSLGGDNHDDLDEDKT